MRRVSDCILVGSVAPGAAWDAACTPSILLATTTALSWRLRNLKGPQPRVFGTVRDARIAIDENLSRADRLQVRLVPQPASVRAARDLVTQACHAWRLPQLSPDSSLVVPELAANAVEHARTDFVVTVSRSDARLHGAVRDGTSYFPHRLEPAFASTQVPLAERGLGLRLVHSVAAAWGAMPARAGKVVWATVT
jgi:anti-sigma regulatory factor (Ser/Thr protein kinase)